MTRDKAFKRTVRNRIARTGEFYTSARMRVLDKQAAQRIAVTNGDSVGGTLRQAALADIVITWKDQLAEGPVPNLSPARLRKVRAAYLSGRYAYSASEVEKDLADRDRALGRRARQDMTLWFEGDVQDQLQLIQILARLGSIGTEHRVNLVSISEHPDAARFGGLGELTGKQLEGLLPVARVVSADGFSIASKAWAAFTAPKPSALISMRGVISRELRHLGDALRRLLQEYPSRSDGLSLSQRRMLLAVDSGRTTWPLVLRSHWESEPRPFLGDVSIKAELQDLSQGKAAALAISESTYTLTAFGRKLLEGSADWVEANGIDRWIGGVHLHGHDVQWRYDERLEAVIASS